MLRVSSKTPGLVSSQVLTFLFDSKIPSRLELPIQGYLAHKNPTPSYDPTVALCLGTYGGPMGVGVSYERGTPVRKTRGGAERVCVCVFVCVCVCV